MSRLLGPVFWRYFAIIAQFVVFVLITRTTDLATAGTYFSLFGFVAVFYVLSGMGTTDALVAQIPWMMRAGKLTLAKQTLIRTWRITLLTSIPAIALITIGFALSGASIRIAMLTALWWLSYAFVFALAQTVISLGRSTAGSFLAYSSINIAYLVVTVPYLVLSNQPKLDGILTSAILSGALAVLLSLAVTVHTFLSSPLRGIPTHRHGPSGSLRGGPSIALSRLMQASLPWTPVWVLTIVGNPAEAAIYAAASRLTVVVTSVIASIRFAGRPDIVTLLHESKWSKISKLSRRVSYISIVPPILGFCFLMIWGDTVVPSVLGSAYLTSVPVLIILMFGVIAEAFGGISDEILKMSGRTWVVLISLASAVGLQVVGCSVLINFGANVIALTTVAAFLTQYLFQMAWLRSRTPINIWPFLFGRRPTLASESFQVSP